MLSANKEDIDRFLSYLIVDDACHFFGAYNATLNTSLGRIEPFHEYKSTVGGYFDRKDYIRFECLRLAKANGYLSINPIARDKMRIASNKVVRLKSGQGAEDKDVSILRHLFIDIDPVKPKAHANDSATHAEAEATVALRDRIIGDHGKRMDLHATGLWGRSGNGCWILARLPDYPNDEKHRKLIVRGLASLAHRYNGTHARIDAKTFNPARVMAIAGTVKCKGPDAPDRPWRLATIDGPQTPAGLS